MNPLLPLASITIHKELVHELSHFECHLRDARCLDTTPQNILVHGQVTRGRHALYRVKVVQCGIVKLELARALKDFFEAKIAPETVNSVDYIMGGGHRLQFAWGGRG